MAELTELGLNRPDTPAPPATPTVSPAQADPPRPAGVPPDAALFLDLAAFLGRLLDVMALLGADADPTEAEAFESRLRDHRSELERAREPEELRALAGAAFRTCEQHLKATKRYRATREEEVAELISILREAAESSLGDSAAFSAEVLSSTERFRALSQLDEIRELKRKLSAEVAHLHQATEAKQRRDQEALVQLNRRVEQLQTDLIKAEEEASIDPLTRVANRRAFDRAIARAVAEGHRQNAPVTLAILDLDSFKNINDMYGHPVGDRILRCAADRFAKSIRSTDLVARYGGEEFAILLHGSDLEVATRRMADLVASIAGQDYEYDAGPPRKTLRFTVSCGTSQLAARDTDADLISRADSALYDAKQQGGNRVVAKRRSRLAGLLGG